MGYVVGTCRGGTCRGRTAAPIGSSAGRISGGPGSALAEAVELPTVTLGGPAGAGVSGEDAGDEVFLGRGRRAEVDQALGRDGGPDALLDDPHDLHDPLAPVEVGLHRVAHLHLRRRLGRLAVHLD